MAAVLNGLSAFAYSFIFKSAHRSGIAVGLHLALFHWAISGFFAGILPAFHPLVGEILPPPGFFMLAAGPATALVFFVAHMIYGATLGWLFDRAAICPETRRAPI